MPAVRLPVVLHDSRAMEWGSHAVPSNHTPAVSKASRGRGQHHERPQRAGTGRGSRSHPGRCVLVGHGGVSFSQFGSVCLPAYPPLLTFTPGSPPPGSDWSPSGILAIGIRRSGFPSHCPPFSPMLSETSPSDPGAKPGSRHPNGYGGGPPAATGANHR